MLFRSNISRCCCNCWCCCSLLLSFVAFSAWFQNLVSSVCGLAFRLFVTCSVTLAVFCRSVVLPTGCFHVCVILIWQLFLQPRFWEYTKFLEADKEQQESLSHLALRKLAVVAPQACRVVPLTREAAFLLSSRPQHEAMHQVRCVLCNFLFAGSCSAGFVSFCEIAFRDVLFRVPTSSV